MYILSINISHHASSCLLNEDGDILYYIEEERLSRIKDHVYENIDENYKFWAIDKVKEFTNEVDYLIFCSFDRIRENDNRIIEDITNQLKESGIDVGEVVFTGEHHYYHACNGFYGSRIDGDAVCLVLDGGGSTYKGDNELTKKFEYPFREVESIYECSWENGIKPLYKHYAYVDTDTEEYLENTEEILLKENKDGCEFVFSDSHSCGDTFNIASSLLGFNSGTDAGKTMGLSSYGRVVDDSEWFREVNGVWIINKDTVDFLGRENFIKTYEKLDTMFFRDRANFAAKVQEQTLKHTLRLIKKAFELSSAKNLVISGGYALNCVNNFKYLEHVPGSLFIDPIAHDGGTALGAAKDMWYKLKYKEKGQRIPFHNLYLG